jgi:hypothetical protein
MSQWQVAKINLAFLEKRFYIEVSDDRLIPGHIVFLVFVFFKTVFANIQSHSLDLRAGRVPVILHVHSELPRGFVRYYISLKSAVHPHVFYCGTFHEMKFRQVGGAVKKYSLRDVKQAWYALVRNQTSWVDENIIRDFRMGRWVYLNCKFPFWQYGFRGNPGHFRGSNFSQQIGQFGK